MDGNQTPAIDGQIIPQPQKPAREVRVVTDAVSVFDTARFEHMYRVATVMAEMSIIPDSLRTGKVDGKDVDLPPHRVVANCFMIVNQAQNWGMDPFAIAQCASVVHGKLMWEGKLVHAVIEAKLGVRLRYTFTHEAESTLQNRKLGVIVSATLPGEDEPRTIEGDVAAWHKGDKSPWSPISAWKRQLRYMGAREWARAHAPGVMLGILADDERDYDEAQAASRPMKTVSPARQSAVAIAAIDIPEEAESTAAPATREPSVDPEAFFPADKSVIDELKARLAKAGPAGVAGVEAAMGKKLMSIDEDARGYATELIQAAKRGG